VTAKRLLFIAYHFPPFQGSTGVHRTLAFTKYLQAYGWEVTVLTTDERAYVSTNEKNNELIPEYVRVRRAFALDAQRQLALFGRYWSLLAVPDRWQSWIIGGYFTGRRIIREWQPHAIMSTYPIASAHVIAAALQRHSGLPWIADLRDPMAQDNYPPEPRVRRSYFAIERMIVRRARRITVTTAGTAELYRKRYSRYPADSVVVIPNGFDPEVFADRQVRSEPAPPRSSGKLRLLHSGLLYPSERDPRMLFAALAELRDAGQLDASQVELAFRGCGFEDVHQRELDRLRLNDLVKLLPPISYAEALQEMAQADACLLLQASNCNQQIPAKLYEYLYSRKPILPLTDPIGDTGQLLAELHIPHITALDDKDAIKSALPPFLDQLRNGVVPLPPFEKVLRYSRRSLTSELAGTLEASVAEWESAPKQAVRAKG
jgi:glycosyltransferase involved in cell wall biosynthesis